jgi:hypothetical protein
MDLQDTLRAAVQTHKPAMLLGVAMQPSAVPTQVNIRTAVSVELQNASVDAALLMLGGVKALYTQICQQMAKQLNVTEQQLDEAIAAQMGRSQITPGPGSR